MPEGNNNDCEKVTFYAPADTFGGPKPIPSCLPGTTRTANELREPNGELESAQAYLSPRSIHITNKTVTAECSEGSTGLAVVLSSGAVSSRVSWNSVSGIDDHILHYIAVNDITTWLEGQVALYSREEFDVNQLAAETGLKLSQAKDLRNEIYTRIDELTAEAQLIANNQLICSWTNEDQTATCSDPQMAHPADNPAAVFSVTIPAGKITSNISLTDANNRARLLAESSLNCFYVSDAVTVQCQDLPGREGTEPVPNDLEPVYENLSLRVGSVTILAGLFISTASKEDANDQAYNYATSQLNCFYVNSELFMQCDDPDARFLGDNPSDTNPVAAVLSPKSKGQYVTVPRGFITSSQSTDAANDRAKTLAESLLECCFINPEIRVSCPDYEVTDEFGNPRYDDAGNPIRIPASQVHSPTYDIVIPAGTYTSCESQEIATQMAEVAVEGQLECYYCNKIVLPACTPDWIIDAVTTGIRLPSALTLADGTVLPAGSIYTLTLPLVAGSIINPYTGKPEDLSTWSTDATVGAPADLICSPEYTQSQQVAENAALEYIDRLPGDSRDDCRFTNDTVIVACAAYDPYDPDNPNVLEHDGVLPTGVKYTYFSKFHPAACLDSTMSAPGPGEYIEIPEGIISVTAAETPGTLPEADPNYDKDTNDALTKAYANQLALIMAQSMLYCVFSNPATIGACEMQTSPANDTDLCGAGAMSTQWVIGTYRSPVGLSTTSHTAANPIKVPKGMFVSQLSLEDVYQQVKAFVESSLVCMYCNDLQSASCSSATKQLNTAVVPACTILASSLAEANQKALALARSMLACVSPTQDGGTGEKGDKGDIGPEGPQGPRGFKGDQGPPGPNCSGPCNGYYN